MEGALQVIWISILVIGVIAHYNKKTKFNREYNTSSRKETDESLKQPVLKQKDALAKQKYKESEESIRQRMIENYSKYEAERQRRFDARRSDSDFDDDLPF